MVAFQKRFIQTGTARVNTQEAFPQINDIPINIGLITNLRKPATPHINFTKRKIVLYLKKQNDVKEILNIKNNIHLNIGYSQIKPVYFDLNTGNCSSTKKKLHTYIQNISGNNILFLEFQKIQLLIQGIVQGLTILQDHYHILCEVPKNKSSGVVGLDWHLIECMSAINSTDGLPFDLYGPKIKEQDVVFWTLTSIYASIFFYFEDFQTELKEYFAKERVEQYCHDCIEEAPKNIIQIIFEAITDVFWVLNELATEHWNEKRQKNSGLYIKKMIKSLSNSALQKLCPETNENAVVVFNQLALKKEQGYLTVQEPYAFVYFMRHEFLNLFYSHLSEFKQYYEKNIR